MLQSHKYPPSSYNIFIKSSQCKSHCWNNILHGPYFEKKSSGHSKAFLICFENLSTTRNMVYKKCPKNISTESFLYLIEISVLAFLQIFLIFALENPIEFWKITFSPQAVMQNTFGKKAFLNFRSPARYIEYRSFHPEFYLPPYI